MDVMWWQVDSNWCSSWFIWWRGTLLIPWIVWLIHFLIYSLGHILQQNYSRNCFPKISSKWKLEVLHFVHGGSSRPLTHWHLFISFEIIFRSAQIRPRYGWLSGANATSVLCRPFLSECIILQKWSAFSLHCLADFLRKIIRTTHSENANSQVRRN